MKNSFEFPLLATVSKQLFLFYYEEEPQPPLCRQGQKEGGGGRGNTPTPE
jgi:hypothetical protein